MNVIVFYLLYLGGTIHDNYYLTIQLDNRTELSTVGGGKGYGTGLSS
jgi:hypothetical protein